MPIDYARLKAWSFPDREHRFEARDSILYALGLGCGSDPTDRDDLRFVYEDGLKALPTMASDPSGRRLVLSRLWRRSAARGRS